MESITSAGVPLDTTMHLLEQGEKYIPCSRTQDNSSRKQCIVNNFCKSLLVGSAPKPLKTRACALWLCRIPASFDLLASPEKQKRKAPVPVKLLRTASDTGALLSFWVLFPSEIFLFWQVVPFQNIKIILDVIQCCKLRFQSFESGIISFFLRFKRLVFGG